jgi:hypothetical protein
LDAAYRMLVGHERLRVASVDLVPKEAEIVRRLGMLTSSLELQSMATA